MRLLNEKEVIELLSVSKHTLRNWRQSGRGPAYVKVGERSIRYREDVIQKFIEDGEVSPSKE